MIDHGVTGYVVEDVTSAAAAVKKAAELPRERVRAGFERRFTARRMAKDYLEVLSQPHLRSVGPGAAGLRLISARRLRPHVRRGSGRVSGKATSKKAKLATANAASRSNAAAPP